MQPFQTAIIDVSQSNINLQINQSQVLFLTGQKLNEPIAMGDPFVMNNQEEIQQAYTDYRWGNFNLLNWNE